MITAFHTLKDEQRDELVVAEAEKLVVAGKSLNAYTGAVLLRLLAEARKGEKQ